MPSNLSIWHLFCPSIWWYSDREHGSHQIMLSELSGVKCVSWLSSVADEWRIAWQFWCFLVQSFCVEYESWLFVLDSRATRGHGEFEYRSSTPQRSNVGNRPKDVLPVCHGPPFDGSNHLTSSHLSTARSFHSVVLVWRFFSSLDSNCANTSGICFRAISDQIADQKCWGWSTGMCSVTRLLKRCAFIFVDSLLWRHVVTSHREHFNCLSQFHIVNRRFVDCLLWGHIVGMIRNFAWR